MIWKVSYECVEDRNSHRPFWKHAARVEADTRLDAIAKVKAVFSPPRYGNYRASKDKTGQPASLFFKG